jgi:phage gpG-like protein
MSAIKIDVFGALSIEKRLALLKLPPAKRRQLLGGIGREIKRQSIRNLKAQRDVEGRAWAPRKRGNDRKLLRRLSRQVAANFTTPDFVVVGFKGAVAYQQHEGVTQVMNAAKMQREGDANNADSPATRKQAKALRDEGYTVKVKGTKKWRKPSLKWITENIQQKQAGLILRVLREQAPKKAWITSVPARSFLGATQQQVNTFVETIYDNTINSRR